MLRGRVHGVSLSCGARVGRGFGHVGGASAGVRESGCTLLGKRNGVSVGGTGGGAQAHKRSAPLSSCSPACLPERSRLFTCGVVGLWCGWRRLRR